MTVTGTTHETHESTGTTVEQDIGRPGEQASPGGRSEARPEERSERDTTTTREATVRMPFITAHFEVRGKGGHTAQQAQGGQRGWKVGPITMPSPTKTAYYLGLGALAVAEVVEWPIAAAIAAGTYVAQHTRGEARAIPEVPHGRKGDKRQEAERRETEQRGKGREEHGEETRGQEPREQRTEETRGRETPDGERRRGQESNPAPNC